MHEINGVAENDLGRYLCVIENVVGITECEAFLMVRSGAEATVTAFRGADRRWTVLALAFWAWKLMI